MDMEALWDKFLEKIKENISSLSYETWFKDTKLVSITENVATVIVPMPFHKKHLVENYKNIIENTFNSLTSTKFTFNFLLEEEWNEEKSKFIEPEHNIVNNYANNNIPSVALNSSIFVTKYTITLEELTNTNKLLEQQLLEIKKPFNSQLGKLIAKVINFVLRIFTKTRT